MRLLPHFERRQLLLILMVAGILAACTPPGQTQATRVRVNVDGKQLVLSTNEALTVGQFLQQNNIILSERDRLYPSDFTQVSDDMLITIVRVQEKIECAEEVVPYTTDTIRRSDLPPGTTKVLQAGENGSQRVCFNIILEDGAEKSRNRSSTTILKQPSNQIVAVGVDTSRIEPIPVSGLLVYKSSGQVRFIQTNSTNQGLLPTGGGLDRHVFALSPDGRQLLFTRKPDETSKSNAYNELWALLDTSSPDATPVRLLIDVLTADWVPGQPFTFSYSTLQPRADPPGYQALNDLYVARLDAKTGKILEAKPLIKPKPGGQYSVWGTEFKWSPDGKYLAWGQADGVGLVDLEAGAYQKIFDFRIYATTLSRGWLWTPSLAWTPDSRLLAASVHGKPYSSETPETSPIFDIAVAPANGVFEINPMIALTGMWAAPRFSPLLSAGLPAQGYMAYLQARTPIDSVSAEYDLIVADRDGSNARALFPDKDKPGIRPLDDGSEIAWSPDGKQIAVVYQGDLHIVDVETGRATRVTIVGNALNPRWTR